MMRSLNEVANLLPTHHFNFAMDLLPFFMAMHYKLDSLDSDIALLEKYKGDPLNERPEIKDLISRGLSADLVADVDACGSYQFWVGTSDTSIEVITDSLEWMLKNQGGFTTWRFPQEAPSLARVNALMDSELGVVIWIFIGALMGMNLYSLNKWLGQNPDKDEACKLVIRFIRLPNLASRHLKAVKLITESAK